MAKVSETDNPLVSVAVTLIERPFSLAGGVPVKVRVEALKVSQDGSAAPLACVADNVSVAPWGSLKVFAARG